MENHVDWYQAKAWNYYRPNQGTVKVCMESHATTIMRLDLAIILADLNPLTIFIMV